MDKKVKSVKIITILSTIIMCISIIVLTCQIVKIANLKNKEKELIRERDYLISEIYNYNSANAYYNNNREEYLENYAREMLGWGEKDEIWYTKK
jgi:cell division protein FtsB